MNRRWCKLLVLCLLCVTLPLQALAALRTHCGPGSDMRMTAPTHAAMSMSMSNDDMAAMHSLSGDRATDHAPVTHTSCWACAACVACTALPTSVVIRAPEVAPSSPIPFLRVTPASVVAARLERPPRPHFA